MQKYKRNGRGEGSRNSEGRLLLRDTKSIGKQSPKGRLHKNGTSERAWGITGKRELEDFRLSRRIQGTTTTSKTKKKLFMSREVI